MKMLKANPFKRNKAGSYSYNCWLLAKALSVYKDLGYTDNKLFKRTWEALEIFIEKNRFEYSIQKETEVFLRILLDELRAYDEDNCFLVLNKGYAYAVYKTAYEGYTNFKIIKEG